LLVYLHPWRHGYDFDCRPWSREAATRGWHFAAPHFRGPNRRPEACASRLARRDAIDAVDAACARVAVDTARIYAGGVSGGGHMALIMAAEAPERWAAVSAWSPISDLAAFYVESVESGAKVHRHIAKIVGGAPSASPHIDAELRFRSPRFQLGKAAALPIDINHGVHDGVPKGIGIQHSIWAFNALAEALGTPPVTDDELVRLLRREYDGAERVDDPTYGRTVYFRRTAGRSRVTLFDGGHEDLPTAACTWFAQHATHL
jgi:pimeloyl-ACP methyl ester carboxylesterase